MLEFPRDGTDRLVCSQCGAKIRVRRSAPATADNGFIRFSCFCGRRLKVASVDVQGSTESQCRCPDCGRVLNVPRESAVSDPETPTTELSPADMAMLDEWARKFHDEPKRDPSTFDLPSPSPWRTEAGMRVCPQCGKPIHLSAEECVACGVAVPRR
jgi:hypothetical protein